MDNAPLQVWLRGLVQALRFSIRSSSMCLAVYLYSADEFSDSPEQGEAGFNALMASFPPNFNKWWVEYVCLHGLKSDSAMIVHLFCKFLPKYEAQTTSALGEGAKFAAWHLQLIGVLPEHQKKGIGGALIKSVESKVESRFESEPC